MRLLTAISIASLVVSIAAVGLVAWLVVSEPWMEHKPSLAAYHPDLSDAQVIDAVRAHLIAQDNPVCLALPGAFTPFLTVEERLENPGQLDNQWWSVEPDPKDPSNPDKYLVTLNWYDEQPSKWRFYLGNVTLVYHSKHTYSSCK